MSSWGSSKPGDASYAEMITQHPQGLKEPEQAAQYIDTLAGDLFFSALLFGGFALLERRIPTLRAQELRTA